MKFILLISALLTSTHSFSQESCLKSVDRGDTYWMCNSSDADKFYSFGCVDQAEICFTGNTREMIQKINSYIFSNGDGGISDANYVNEDEINYYFWDVGTGCGMTAKRCK